MLANQFKTFLGFHLKTLLDKPILFSLALMAQCLAAFSLLIIKDSELTNSKISFYNTLPFYQNMEQLYYNVLPDDGITLKHEFQGYKWTIFMCSHLVFFYVIFDMVTEEKRNNIYLLIRKLGADEKLYWGTVAITGFMITATSNILGTFFIKNILVEHLSFFNNVDFAPLFILLQASSMTTVCYGIFWSSFIKKKEFVALMTLIFGLGYIRWISVGASPYPAGYKEITVTFVTGESETISGWWLTVYNLVFERYHNIQTPAYEIATAMTNMLRIITATGLGKIQYDLKSLFFPALCKDCLAKDILDQLPPCFFSSPTLSLLIMMVLCVAFFALSVVIAEEYGTIGYLPADTHKGPFDELNVTNLEKIYFGKIKMISDFTYKFHKGKVYSILGKGNSTLLNLISGKIQRTGGLVQYSGNLGFLEQEPTLIEGLSALEHITLYLSLLNYNSKVTGGIKEYSINLLSKVGLASQINKSISQFGPGLYY